jgi:glutamate-5-semialdehyde dehydrogenase
VVAQDTLSGLLAAARDAAAGLAATPSESKSAALQAMADALEARAAEIIPENEADLAAARKSGAAGAVLDRLALDEDRIRAMAAALRQIADLPDPVGDVLEERTAPSGIRIRKIRVPLGVIGVIYEGRPNVTVDAAALAVRAGNAVVLRGSSIAARSNAVLARIIQEAGEAAGLPAATIQSVPPSRESARGMMRARGAIDLLIPRGGNDLIQTVVTESLVPVVETGIGNCHVYVDREADLEKALRILVNAKVQRPGVCNAAESFLVQREVAAEFLPKALAALREHGG